VWGRSRSRAVRPQRRPSFPRFPGYRTSRAGQHTRCSLLMILSRTSGIGATIPFTKASAKVGSTLFSATQPSRRERLLLPLTGPCGRERATPRSDRLGIWCGGGRPGMVAAPLRLAADCGTRHALGNRSAGAHYEAAIGSAGRSGGWCGGAAASVRHRTSRRRTCAAFRAAGEPYRAGPYCHHRRGDG